ncbi:MAG TPA: HAD-IIIC family phosphatase [Candidatus Acidoferrales bacterium]
MTKNVVLLGDKTLSLLARNLNSQLREGGSTWNSVDAGYDTWLVAPRDVHGVLFAAETAAWAFVLSPRVLENVPDIAVQLDATLESLRHLETPPTVLFSTFFADPAGAMPLSSNIERHALAGKLNEQLLAFREAHPWFYVVDHLSLVLQHGVDALYDARFEASAQIYFSPKGSRLLSGLWFRVLRSLERPQKKVCVVDLDNTLWGGILGEDGPDGLQMADSGVGSAYRRFQRSLLELRRNGILLTACSKNNPKEAMAVLQSHPDCLLRPNDFAHIELGWGLKSEAIARTAQKLGLGLDSFVFVDDSAVEREEVLQALPLVDVLDSSGDPTRLVGMLSQYPGFDSLRQTDEDRKRADSYLEEVHRGEVKSKAASAEDFYRSLGLKLGIFSARGEQAVRLHQLLMKTNQFNMTAERIPVEEFRELLDDRNYMVLGLRVSDRFGDSGITGLAIVDRRHPQAWRVRNFLLSCRVLGRTVENAFISWLVERALSSHADTVELRFLATERNQVAYGFLETSGGKRSDAGDIWTFDADRPGVLPPHFVTIDDEQVG